MPTTINYSEYKKKSREAKLGELRKFWGLSDKADFDFIGEIQEIEKISNGLLGDTNIRIRPLKVENIDKKLTSVNNPFDPQLGYLEEISGQFNENDLKIEQIDFHRGNLISVKIAVISPQNEIELPIKIEKIVGNIKQKKYEVALSPIVLDIISKINAAGKMEFTPMPEGLFSAMEAELVTMNDQIERSVRISEEKKEEIYNLNNQLAALQSELENEKSRIKKAVTTMDEKLSAYREKRKQDIDNDLNESIQNETTMLSRLKTEKERLYAKLQSYRQRGFMLNIADIEERQNEYEEKALDALEIAKKIQVYLHSEKKLQYDISILNQFLLALRTNQLIVLCGPPGTGKTSLVEGFAEAIGAKAKIMSVQPNWTDNQDLLGFFNPIEKRYISTPFLDTLIEARENPRKLYLLCLDEMNLAHVEYYFAEFLSKMESSTKTLDLYSEKYYRDLMTEFALCDQRYGMLSITEMKKQAKDISEDLERINEFAMNCPIEPRFRIPENVRFIGTINLDETTKTLSPKVIDRSYFIEIPDVDGAELKRQIDGETASEKQMLFAAVFMPIEKELDKESKEWIDKRVKELQKLKVSCSKRMMKHLKELYGSWPGPEKDFNDYVLSGKILPQIAYAIEDDEDRGKIIKNVKQVIENINDMEVSSSKLNRMLIQIDSASYNQFTYWG